MAHPPHPAHPVREPHEHIPDAMGRLFDAFKTCQTDMVAGVNHGRTTGDWGPFERGVAGYTEFLNKVSAALPTA